MAGQNGRVNTRPGSVIPFLDKSNVEVWKALNATALRVRVATDSAGLSREVVELLNLRVSQLNGCAYCLELHGRLALEAGVPAQKIHVLSEWRRTELFTPVERAALAVAEVTTELPGEGELVYEINAARGVLGDEKYAALAWAAVAMNAFNRVSMISRHPIRAASTAAPVEGAAP
jgi:AhpD family alkylhydroperoxidase